MTRVYIGDKEVRQQSAGNLYQYNKGKSRIRHKKYPIEVRWGIMLMIEEVMKQNGNKPVEAMYTVQDYLETITFDTLKTWWYYRKKKMKEQYRKKFGILHPADVIKGETDLEKKILKFFGKERNTFTEGAKELKEHPIDDVETEEDGVKLRLVADGTEIPIIIAEVNELRDMLDTIKEELEKSLKEIKKLKKELKGKEGKEKLYIDAIEAERRILKEIRVSITNTMQEIAGKVKVKAGLYIKDDSDPEFMKLVDRMDVFLHVLEKKIPNVRQLWIDIMVADDITDVLIEDYMDSNYFIPPEKDYMQYWYEVQEMFKDIDDPKEIEKVENNEQS